MEKLRTKAQHQLAVRFLGISGSGHAEIVNRYLALYDEFISRLEQDHMIDVVKNGTGGESCPPIRGWAPLEEELKAWGIKGITEFWYPKTEEDFALVEKKTGLPTKYIFFGSSNSFSALCRSRSAFENSPSALKPNN